MNYTTTWTLDFSDKISSPMDKVQKKLNETAKKVDGLGDSVEKVSAIDWQAATNGVTNLLNRFEGVAKVGENYEASLLEVSAITGVTGDKLQGLGDKARSLAKEFGTGATQNLETFKTVLSRLGPDIGKSDKALASMGKSANILSKTMENDVTGATDALTTSMLQFKVDLDDPIKAADEMNRMMNVMAAGAKEGAAEVPQVSKALEQSGGAASLAKVSYEEANAAIQALAETGKYGAEAGVGLRNVLLKMNAPSSISEKANKLLETYGVNMEKVSNTTIPFAERLKELQKIGKNTDALAAVFGSENIQAAQGLINSADAQAKLTKKITGTNVAYEQAEIVMSGWGEKMKRAKVWFEDLQIAGFGVTKVLGVLGSVGSSAVSVAGDMGAAYSGLAPILRNTSKWFKATAMYQKLSAFWTKIATGVQWAWNAALSANPIGLIIVAIAAMIGLIVLAINKFDSWGSSMLILLGPIGMVVSAVMMVKRHWDSIVEAFQSGGIIGGLKRIGLVLLDVIMHPIQRILGWVAELTGMDWAKKAQNSVAEFRTKMELVTPEEKPQKDDLILGKADISAHGQKKEITKKDKFSKETTLGGLTKPKSTSPKTKSINGGGGSNKTINFKVEMKNYFNIDRSIGSKEVAANNIVSKINDRLRDAAVTL